MAKLGKPIIWQETTAEDWDDLSDEEKAVFIELATPTPENIILAQSLTVDEIEPFLNATLKEAVIG